MYRVTSREEPRYNCIAWSVGDNTRWWWPNRYGFWPIQHTGVSVQTFVQMYAIFSYSTCPGDKFEPYFEKVALYTLNGVPTHAARELDTGEWTSKLGGLQDIAHTTPSDIPPEIESRGQMHNIEYGSATLYFRRRVDHLRALRRSVLWALRFLRAR